tara:strand:+ start:4381 stop:5673 length:1293 start_codon:yes stop_codon:yes gene_type:complete
MSEKICVVGLGYVGLPLAVEFAKKYITIGFDINNKRINELNKFIDNTLEISSEDLKENIFKNQNDLFNQKNGLFLSNEIDSIKPCNIYIITVPTPINNEKKPDLDPIISATNMIANIIKKEDVVIYESTVYPGLTEEICMPILEKVSGLKYNQDFFLGYSPERINPGDKLRTITKIVKITSGSNKTIAKKVDKLYSSIIEAGTYLAPSIKVAEAAKVIENSQRDINIAYVNELAKIFNLLDIDTNDVLKAASTKWNFLQFKPGLVGGHCIGVDPYYLSHKSIEVGYTPEIILGGRKLNDSMGEYVANQIISFMTERNIEIKKSKILILGITFKENCPDIRNTKVVDLINSLKLFVSKVDIYDPWANTKEVEFEYGINIENTLNQEKKYDCITLAVPHNEFKDLNISKLKKQNSFVYDIKGFLGDKSDKRL